MKVYTGKKMTTFSPEDSGESLRERSEDNREGWIVRQQGGNSQRQANKRFKLFKDSLIDALMLTLALIHKHGSLVE